jgi:hypothetical protein
MNSFLAIACLIGFAVSIQDYARGGAVRANRFQVAGIGDPESSARMLAAIQKAVRDGDKNALASMVAYPIKTYFSGKPRTIKNRRTFVKHYGEIIDRKVKDAVARQQAADLFANYQGVMIGDGQIWFGPRKTGSRKLHIIAITNGVEENWACEQVLRLPEAKAWDAFMRKKTSGKYHGCVIADSDRPERISGRMCLPIAFMEDGPDAMHRWQTFEVDVDTGKVMVLDATGEYKLLTLKQWRKREHPMDRVK